jgi:hypothetical protein
MKFYGLAAITAALLTTAGCASLETEPPLRMSVALGGGAAQAPRPQWLQRYVIADADAGPGIALKLTRELGGISSILASRPGSLIALASQ